MQDLEQSLASVSNVASQLFNAGVIETVGELSRSNASTVLYTRELYKEQQISCIHTYTRRVQDALRSNELGV
jgi:hypothetical protein